MSPDRYARLGELRGTLIARAVDAVSAHMRDPLVAGDTTALDRAAMALADKLREVERCHSCGGVIPPDGNAGSDRA